MVHNWEFFKILLLNLLLHLLELFSDVVAHQKGSYACAKVGYQVGLERLIVYNLSFIFGTLYG